MKNTQPVIGSTSQSDSSPPPTPESVEKLKDENDALRKRVVELEELTQQYHSVLVKRSRSEEDSDGDEDVESPSSSDTTSPPQPPLTRTRSPATVPPAKKPRPKDVSKRMRDLYNEYRLNSPQLGLPTWESAPEGYVRILSIPEIKARVSEDDRRKMGHSLSKHSADKLLQWCHDHLFLVESLPEKSLSAIKRLLTSRQKSKEFVILSTIPNAIGHNGGLCMITGVFFDQNMCIIDPSQVQVRIGIPNQQSAVNVETTDVRPTKFVTLLPPCPFQFPPGENILPVELSITIRNETRSTPYSYIKVNEFDFTSQNLEHSPESAPPGDFRQGSPGPADSGGSSQPPSSSSTSGGQSTSPNSVSGRQNVLGQLELHRVAFEGDLKRVDRILNETPDDVIVKDNFGRTPAHYAAFSVEKRTLRHLLRAGGSKFTTDFWGLTPSDIYTFQVANFPRMKPTSINDLFADDEMTASDDETEELPVSPKLAEKPQNTANLQQSLPVNLSLSGNLTLASSVADLIKSQQTLPSSPPVSPLSPTLGSAMDMSVKIVQGKTRPNSGSVDSKKVVSVMETLVGPLRQLAISKPTSTVSHASPEDF